MPPSRRRTVEPEGYSDTLVFGNIAEAAPVGDATVMIDGIGGLDPAGTRLDDGTLIVEEDDGGVTVDLDGGLETGPAAAFEHDANLADFLSEETLNSIASDLVEGIDADLQSGDDYRALTARAIELLGIKPGEKDWPFKGACTVTDPLMLEALIRVQATAMAEMLPASGPVKTAIIGVSNDEVEARAWRVKEWMNYYLTEVAPEYYDDYDQMLFWLFLMGSSFKKTYQDPLLGRPVSPYLTPDDLIVAYGTTSLATCPRVTHRFSLNKRDLMARQLAGFYRNVELGEPEQASSAETQVKAAVNAAQGVTPDTAQKDDSYTIYECHVDLNIPGFEHEIEAGIDKMTGQPIMEKTEFPLPYIVTLDKTSQKVLSVYRNWKAGDAEKRKRNWFTHYKFLPGLGFYGFGYCHILAPHTDASSKILRQLIDLGTLNNFPGGVRAKGVRMETNNLLIGPCQFPEVDTGGLPIQHAFMPLPYKEPAPVMRELRKDIEEAARRLAGTTEIAVGDGRQDAPVGTTMALIEAATKVESAAIKRIHRSMRDELRLFKELFGEFLNEEPYPFPVQGGVQMIMRADFDGHVDVLPVSDPNFGSQISRMIRAEARLRLGQQAAEIHDMRELYKDVYISMGVDQTRIDKILPLPAQAQPMDPISENQIALKGGPLAVGEWQNDDAHIAVHTVFAQLPAMSAHISEHLGNKFRKQIQTMLGIQLPPLGQQIPPEIENQIAALAAQAAEIISKQDPNTPEGQMAVEMAAIQVKAQEVEAEIYAADLKAKTERYKADVKARTESEKIASRERTESVKAFASVQKGKETPNPEARQALNRGR